MNEWKLKAREIDKVVDYDRVLIPQTPLASQQEAILEFLDTNEIIKNSQVIGLTEIRFENAMKNVFCKLRDQGFIERVPVLECPASAWKKAVKKLCDEHRHQPTGFRLLLTRMDRSHIW